MLYVRVCYQCLSRTSGVLLESNQSLTWPPLSAHRAAYTVPFVPKESTIQSALHLKTTVLPGGKIEITDQILPSGEVVDVIILFPPVPETARRSAADILAEAPEHRLFKT